MTKVEKIFGKPEDTKYEGFMSCKASHVDGYVPRCTGTPFCCVREPSGNRSLSACPQDFLTSFAKRRQRVCSVSRCPALRIRSQYVVFNVEDAVHVFQCILNSINVCPRKFTYMPICHVHQPVTHVPKNNGMTRNVDGHNGVICVSGAVFGGLGV